MKFVGTLKEGTHPDVFVSFLAVATGQRRMGEAIQVWCYALENALPRIADRGRILTVASRVGDLPEPFMTEALTEMPDPKMPVVMVLPLAEFGERTAGDPEMQRVWKTVEAMDLPEFAYPCLTIVALPFGTRAMLAALHHAPKAPPDAS